MVDIDYQPKLLNVKLARSIEEEHGKQVFTCRFCDNIPAYYNYFATAATTWASIYHVVENTDTGNFLVELVQSYSDNDREEQYYCCTWASRGTSVPILLLAGKRGSIKGVLLAPPFEIVTVLLGHGDSVYDLRTHSVDDGLIISASKDESIRLWNIRASVCVAIFAGAGGHRNAVLAIDIHPLGNVFASSGMDTSIKIWNLQTPSIIDAIKASDKKPRGEDNKSNFRSITQQFPLFSTQQVHQNYVDAVKWVGDCLLTKATGEGLVLWAPDSTRYANATIVLRKFSLPACKIWYSQMDIFLPFDVAAVGSDDGRVSRFLNIPFYFLLHSFFYKTKKVHVFSLSKLSEKESDSSEPDPALSPDSPVSETLHKESIFQHIEPRRAAISVGNSQYTNRCVSFHPLGNYIISSNERGEVSIWNVNLTT